MEIRPKTQFVKTILSIAVASTAWGALFAPSVLAQGRSLVLEEIVVTARKRGSEILQDIPATITAFSETKLELMGVTDFKDFAYHVPGLTFNDENPGQKRYVIRGIQSAGQQQVAVYYDEVPIPGVQSSTSDSGSQTTDLKLFDMNRIEVLKGPQGTTFGANSQTGTVRFVTNKPDLENFSAKIGGMFSQSGKSDDTNNNLHAMVNLPMMDGQLGLRAVIYNEEMGGYVDNVRLNQKDINSAKTTGLRTQLRWAPTDTFTLDASFWYEDRDLGGDSHYHPFDTFNQRPNSNDQGHKDNVSPSTFFRTGDFQVGDYTQTFKPDTQRIFSLTANWDLGWADLVATGSTYERDFGYKVDSTWIILFLGAEGVRDDLYPALTQQDQTLEQTSFEVRLNSAGDGPFHWMGGVFYRERESEFQSFVPVTNEQGLTFDPGYPPTGPSLVPGAGIAGCLPCVFARVADKDIEETAVFGEVSLELGDKWEIMAGLRWFEVEQSDFGDLLFNFALFTDFIPPPNSLTVKSDEIIQKYQLSFKPNDDITTYVLASQGFRLGGTNNQGIVDIPEQFESDELWNYEIGLKSTWFDGRMNFNAAIYHVVWDNLQVSGQDPTGAFGFIGNAGEAEVDGIEMELYVVPTATWDLGFGLSYLFKHELTEDQVSDDVVAPGKSGDEIARVPELTYNISAQYNFSYGSTGWEGWLRSDYVYKDESGTELSPGSPNYRIQEDYALWNLSLGGRIEEHGLDVTLFWDNVLDEDADVFISTANGEPTGKITSRPSTVGMRFTKAF